MFIYSLFLSGFAFAAVKDVLLIPNHSFLYLNTFLNNDFLQEHNVETVATFQDFTVYKTSLENYYSFESTFNNMFHVEEDSTVSIVDSNQQVNFILKPEWHLDRITNGEWNFGESGSCHKNDSFVINTYVIDTGIDVNHPEFDGRAQMAANFIDYEDDTDKVGHGTHCSGLVGSKSFGVCKDAKLFGVKVLDSRGSGSLSGVIKGIEFVYKEHLKAKPNVRSIISMSLGGSNSKALTLAIEKTLKTDFIYYSVAAGNENNDACLYSPGNSKAQILTVMAMNIENSKSYFSNFGKCAHIYAPGEQILSTIPNGKTARYSGTSMATPIVTGVINHYLDMYPYMTMKQIKKKILEDSISDVIKNNPENTPNKLVYLKR